MKLIACIVLLWTNVSFGQSFEVAVVDDTMMVMSSNTQFVRTNLTNTTADTLDLDIIREINYLPPGWISGLCVDSVCEFATTDSVQIQIAPFATKEFRMYFQVLGTPADTAHTYILFRNANSSNDFQFQQYYATLDSEIGVPELLNSGEKTLIKVVDLMGREVPVVPNTTLIYLYSDGTSEKVYSLEN